MISFRMKNGMARKAAADDADMTVDDYVGTSVDNYKFMADFNAPPKSAGAAAPHRRRRRATTPQPTPASASQQPKH